MDLLDDGALARLCSFHLVVARTHNLGVVQRRPATLGVGDNVINLEVVPSQLRHAFPTGLWASVGAHRFGRGVPDESSLNRVERSGGVLRLKRFAQDLAQNLLARVARLTAISVRTDSRQVLRHEVTTPRARGIDSGLLKCIDSLRELRQQCSGNMGAARVIEDVILAT